LVRIVDAGGRPGLCIIERVPSATRRCRSAIAKRCDARKHAIADRIVGNALPNETACISFQVVRECLNTVLRKAKVALDDASARA
jgi:hypothetical protein